MYWTTLKVVKLKNMQKNNKMVLVTFLMPVNFTFMICFDFFEISDLQCTFWPLK